MASTLCKRICDESLLTERDVADIQEARPDLGLDRGSMKLMLHAVVGVAGEIQAGTIPLH